MILVKQSVFIGIQYNPIVLSESPMNHRLEDTRHWGTIGPVVLFILFKTESSIFRADYFDSYMDGFGMCVLNIHPLFKIFLFAFDVLHPVS